METQRIKRKNVEIDYVSGEMSPFDMFDNHIKRTWRINDDEYEYIAKHASEDEIGMLVIEELSFRQKREALTILNKYVKEYHEKN